MRTSAFGLLGPGWFSDVAFVAGRGYVMGGFDVPGQSQVRVRIAAWTGADLSGLTTIWAASLVEGYGYSRLYADGGTLWAAWHDGRVGHLRDVLAGTETVLDPCEGSCPIVLGARAVAWQGAQADGWPVTLMRLANGQTYVMRAGVGTGLSRIQDDWIIRTVDEDRLTLPGATQPGYAGDLAVGEGPDGGVRWRLGTDTGMLWPGQSTFTPKCAVDGDRVAITCGGGDGVRLFCGSRAELLETRGQPVEPKPKPKPKPDPKEQPKVDVPNRFDIVQRVFDRGGHELKAQSGCGRFTEACAVELHAADGQFGHLKKRPGQNQFNGHAVDAVLFKATGQAVDIISDSEGDHATPAWGVDIPRYTADDWTAPDGVEPDPDPDPEPEGDLAATVERLAHAIVVMDANVLEQGKHLDEALARIEALEKHPGGVPANVAIKGDGVTVHAKLPLVGNVVAHGTIDV